MDASVGRDAKVLTMENVQPLDYGTPEPRIATSCGEVITKRSCFPITDIFTGPMEASLPA